MRTSCRPSLEALENRLTPSCTVVFNAPDQLVITGDSAPDTVALRDDGAGNITGFATGYGAINFSGVRGITVNTEGGNDAVSYDLTGPLQGRQYVLVGLGSNFDPSNIRDQFDAHLFGGIRSGARLDLLAGGGAGNDYINVNATGLNIDAGGILKTTLSGGFGDDAIIQNYSGHNDGIVTLRANGGDGNDTFRQLMAQDSTSTGQLCAVLKGDAGNDVLSLQMYLAPGQSPTTTSVDGGDGNDIANVTSNVSQVTAETINWW